MVSNARITGPESWWGKAPQLFPALPDSGTSVTSLNMLLGHLYLGPQERRFEYGSV
jgi:hypothetical protein